MASFHAVASLDCQSLIPRGRRFRGICSNPAAFVIHASKNAMCEVLARRGRNRLRCWLGKRRCRVLLPDLT